MSRALEPKDRLIFPLDVADLQQARRYIELLQDEVGMFKVGLELFVVAGPQLCQSLATTSTVGFFLDLKFHDIPATMRAALHNLFPGVHFTTIHCEQGVGLQEATAAARAKGIRVLGVTVLTSLGTTDLLAAGIDPQYAEAPVRLVLLRAALAKAAGCAGVVCAPTEAQAVKRQFGQDFLVVCPGIRPDWAAVPGDDQKRILTPQQAIRAGADYVVVGRPIRQAANPVAAARQIVAEIAAALDRR
ncbi:MAG: orotidine-5'-phosphate decarboxylase [Desulfobacca sp.]|uniref:orotidine-5'-phosphate decarboxylase n=1 Tax=Desulfobacca sp. TaxID=2067990 RepID=UPI00404AF72B